MYNPERQLLDYILVFSFVFVIFSWKVPIIRGYGNGIRVDDFLLFILLFLFICSIIYNGKLNWLFQVSYLLFIFVIWNLFCGITSYVLGSQIKLIDVILYSLRHIEYWIMIFVGFYWRSKKTLNTILIVYTIHLFIIVILQKKGVIGGVTQFNVQERPAGNLGGPWELAAVSAFLIFWFFYEKKYFLSLTAFITLWLSAARITILSVILVFWLGSVLSKRIEKRVRLLVFLFLPVLIGSIVLFSKSYVVERYTAIFSSDLPYYLLSFADAIPEVISKSDYEFLDITLIKQNLGSVPGDPSLVSRVSRWMLLLSLMINSGWTSFFIGKGPSFVGLALDSYYLRLIAEVGVIGMILYLLLLFSVLKQTRSVAYFSSYILTLLLTGIFIDIFVTYKAMALFWFFYGYVLREKVISSEVKYFTNPQLGDSRVQKLVQNNPF